MAATPMPRIAVFHASSAENCAAILQLGFKDVVGTYLTDQEWAGVWVSDRPLDVNEGLSNSDGLLRIELACDLPALDDFEWVEEGKPYREWLVPADLLNKLAVSISKVAEEVDDDA